MLSPREKVEIAKRLLAVREALNLSQSIVAKKARCTQRSVAEIEKCGSFSMRLLREIAAALNLTESWLLTGTGPKHVTGSEKLSEESASEEYRIEKSGVHLERINKPWVEVPVISWASAGNAKDYADLEEFLEEKVMSDCRDPNAFAVIVDGDSMSPVANAGDRIVIAPNTEAKSGDLVIARTLHEHEVYFKKFSRYGPHGQKVRLTSFNPDYPPLEFDLQDFRFIYPVVNLFRTLRHINGRE